MTTGRLGGLLAIGGLVLFVVAASNFNEVLVVVGGLVLAAGVVLTAWSLVMTWRSLRAGVSVFLAGVVITFAAMFAMSQLGEYRTVIVEYIALTGAGLVAIVVGIVVVAISVLRHPSRRSP